jgi:hypothetical protein
MARCEHRRLNLTGMVDDVGARPRQFITLAGAPLAVAKSLLNGSRAAVLP